MNKLTKNQGTQIPYSAFLAAAGFLSVAEALLILGGVLPHVLTYSKGNLAFSIMRLALSALAGIYFASQGVKRCLLKGATMGGVASGILVICSLIGKTLFNRPILGINIPGNFYLPTLLLIIIENVLLWAFIAAFSSWITGRVLKR